jgi:polyhydroxyalkanoate synthase
MIAYPGRTFGQLYHRFVKGNTLKTGAMAFGDRTISISSITAPVLVFAGATDGIAPVNAVKAIQPLLTGAREVRFEIVPGGHLGMLTGRAARGTTWRVMDEWIEEWSTRSQTEPVASPVTGGAAPAAAKRSQIGSNPSRRYGSKSSRSLAR